MPADWTLPVNTTAYNSVLGYLDAKDRDAITLCYAGDPSNIPTGAKKWNIATKRLQEWNGATWVDLVLDIGSGGTGAISAALARTNLGLGDMATQNSNSVAITGGSLAGASLRAQDLTSGTVAQARLGSGSTGLGQSFLADDQTWKPSTAFSPGMIVGWSTNVAPAGWLICDGSAISRAVYANLFAVISTTYGVGDGSTTFNIPDLRQRFILGKAAAGTGSTLAGTGGNIDHTHIGGSHSHSIGSDGAHTHTVNAHTHTGPSHNHSGNTGSTEPPNHGHNFNNTFTTGTESGVGWTVQLGGAPTANVPVQGHTHSVTVNGNTGGITSSIAHSHSIGSDGTGATGSASPATNSQGAHTHGGATGAATAGTTDANNPPFLVLNYIIKT